MVETAGNGASNMDHSSYATYHSWGDNGAIIEGAGTANTSHDRMSYSTYGARVNMQGWGERTFTLGYGGGWSGSSDWRQSYTSTFSGTSSSGPIVTSAVALCQSYAKENKDTLITCLQMRSILMATGTPQGSGYHIGPLPNLRAAFARIDSLYPTVAVTEKIVREKVAAEGVFFTADGIIHYYVPGQAGESSLLTISIFDCKGSLKATLVNGRKSAGQHRVALPPGNLAPGIYLCSMKAADTKYAARIIVR